MLDLINDDRVFFEAFSAAQASDNLVQIQRWKDELDEIIQSPSTPMAMKDLAKSRYNDLSLPWRGC